MLAEHTGSTAQGRNVRRVFADGFGKRYQSAAREENDALLEVLCFRHEITDVPSFEFALRERVARLAQFSHPDYARVRKVDRLNDDRGTVALMADGTDGLRLSELLADLDRNTATLDLSAALFIVQQLTAAIAALHEQARVAHGAIALERVFVTPAARVRVGEYAMGAALEQLKYTRERYWKELRVAVPADVAVPRIDEHADITQVGVVALSLILARPLRDDEYPAKIEQLIGSASAHAVNGAQKPLPPNLREWLRRALQLDAPRSFQSIAEAQSELEQVIRGAAIKADGRALESFLQRYHQRTPAVEAPPKPMLVTEKLVRFDSGIDEPPAAPPPAAPPTLPAASPVPSLETSDEIVEDEQPMTYSAKPNRGKFKWIAAGIGLAVVATAGVFAARGFAPTAPAVVTGTVAVNTNPPGAEVQVDGESRGQTPISLTLAAGEHTITVRGKDGESRTIPLTVTAGAQMSHHVELPKAASLLGQLNVRTEPAGARISIDGTPLGKTPMTIVELTPGEHTVTLENDAALVTQKVTIEAGVAASLVVPMAVAPGAVQSGWMSVTSPVSVDLLENGRLLGSSGIDRIMLPAGKHEIELVNELLGYRDTRIVQVTPGRVTPITVTLPKGVASINAVPWASVTIDGESVGDTPIGNLPLTIGPHEVVFRNTELGEQRRVITVTTRAPVRLSVDMAKK